MMNSRYVSLGLPPLRTFVLQAFERYGSGRKAGSSIVAAANQAGYGSVKLNSVFSTLAEYNSMAKLGAKPELLNPGRWPLNPEKQRVLQRRLTLIVAPRTNPFPNNPIQRHMACEQAIIERLTEENRTMRKMLALDARADKAQQRLNKYTLERYWRKSRPRSKET